MPKMFAWMSQSDNVVSVEPVAVVETTVPVIVRKRSGLADTSVDFHISAKVRPVDNCPWEFYGRYCNETLVAGGVLCVRHSGIICMSCDNDANHACPVELQFVCGMAACAEHKVCTSHSKR